MGAQEWEIKDRGGGCRDGVHEEGGSGQGWEMWDGSRKYRDRVLAGI